MPPQEPSLANLSNPLLRYFLATRPAFLSVTLVGCLIGFATAFAAGIPLSGPLAAATLIFALVAHAGINVVNDYYDARNGTDAVNTERIFPYTGGSRFIQNGVLTEGEIGWFGAALFVVVVAAGVVLARTSGGGLYVIGALGLFIGWAYSAAPLKLNSRGVGEICVALGFALIVIGADFVQRRAFALAPIVAAVSYALLVADVLYINQFPDRAADARAGKRHWVVRLPVAQARWGYVAVAVASYLWLIGAVVARALPIGALLAVLTAPLSFVAARTLVRYAHTPSALRNAIEITIFAACAHGVLLAAGLTVSRWLP